MTIRMAKTEDIPAVAALEAVCFPADPWPERFFTLGLGSLLVAVEDGAILGYAALSSVQGSLDNIAVALQRRRQGVADALLATVEAMGQARELSFITLEVRASNKAAIALYEKHGFAPVGRRTNYYEKPREDAVLMTLVMQ